MTPRRTPPPRLSRRELLRGAAALGLLAACGRTPREFPTVYDGYLGLAELPFFEVRDGRLVVAVDDLPPSIDFHGHLGFSLSISNLDYQQRTDEVRYLIDCDAMEPPCMVDLDPYLNHIATDEMLVMMEEATVQGVLSGDGPAATHTVPNLVAEMDDMGFDRSVLLPIALNLLDPDDMTEVWAQAVIESGEEDRFVRFASVHPDRSDALAQLRAYQAQGYPGIKLHPTMQGFDPDNTGAMLLYEECDRAGTIVFFHAGRAGIEPENTRDYALMPKYRAPIEEFPDVQFVFGHSGARDFADAFPLALEYDNVWLDLHGQGLPNLREAVDRYDTRRLLFGSDWPFYPLAASLAKILIVTDGRKRVRDRILSKNARRLLGL